MKMGTTTGFGFGIRDKGEGWVHRGGGLRMGGVVMLLCDTSSEFKGSFLVFLLSAGGFTEREAFVARLPRHRYHSFQNIS